MSSRSLGFSLLVVLLACAVLGMVPTGSPNPDQPWVVEDAVGDQATLFSGVPSNALAKHTDLTLLEIRDEDEESLTFSWRVANLRVDPDGSCCLEEGNFELTFQVEGFAPTYEAQVSLRGGYAADAQSTFVAVPSESTILFGICPSGECDYWWDLYRQPAELHIDDASDTVSVRIPKSALMGLHGSGKRPSGIAPDVDAGTKLTNIQLVSSYYVGTAVQDWAPETGESPGPYILKQAAANTRVRFQLQDGDDELGIIPGGTTPLIVQVSNHAASKRLINLTYGFEGEAADVSQYGFAGPAAVSVPAGETRPVRIELSANPGAPDGVKFWMRGRSFGPVPDAAYTQAVLRPSAPMGPGSNILYLLARAEPYADDVRGGLVCKGPARLFSSACYTGILSASPTDPSATAERIQGWAYSSITETGQEFWIEMTRELPVPLVLDAAKPIRFDLKTDTSVPIEGARVTATLYASRWNDQQVLFSSSTTATLTPGGTVAIEGPVHVEERGATERVVPAGSTLFLVVELKASLSAGANIQEVMGGIELVPKESKAHLPLLEIPEDLLEVGKPSPFQVAVLGDREAFVNPGEARLFNVTVLNQDAQPRRVDLKVDAPWTAELLPGDAFDLGPGESVRLGLLLYAPADAEEGEPADSYVNATSEGQLPVGVRVRAIATNGADLPDDANRFMANPDDAAKLAHEAAGSSPAPSAYVAVLLAFATLALQKRARVT